MKTKTNLLAAILLIAFLPMIARAQMRTVLKQICNGNGTCSWVHVTEPDPNWRPPTIAAPHQPQPVAPAQPNPVATPPTQGAPLVGDMPAWKKTGTDPSKIGNASAVTYGPGQPRPATNDPYASAPLPPDDYMKPYIVAIGNQAQREHAERAYENSRFRDEFLFKSYKPDDWEVKDVGYRTGVYIVGPRDPANHQGEVIHKQESFYDLENAMKTVIKMQSRRADPIAAELPAQRQAPPVLPIPVQGNRKRSPDFDDRDCPNVNDEDYEAKARTFWQGLDRWVKQNIPFGWLTVAVLAFIFRFRLTAGFHRLKAELVKLSQPPAPPPAQNTAPVNAPTPPR